MLEQIINVDRMEQAVSLFGSFDENVRLIEQHYGVDIVSRGSDLKVSGEGEGVAKAVRAIEGLLQLINRGEQLNEQNVRYVLTLVDEGSDQELPQLSGDSIWHHLQGTAGQTQDPGAETIHRGHPQQHGGAGYRARGHR